MKLDHDLARDVLLLIEDSQSPDGPSGSELMAFGESHNAEIQQVAYILDKLYEGGLITDYPKQTIGGGYILKSGNLSYYGHEYLDNIRDNGVWKQVKKKIASNVGSASLSVVTQLASKVIGSSLGLN